MQFYFQQSCQSQLKSEEKYYLKNHGKWKVMFDFLLSAAPPQLLSLWSFPFQQDTDCMLFTEVEDLASTFLLIFNQWVD